MAPKLKFLITGTSSGLGQYLMEELDGTPFRRTDIPYEMEKYKRNCYNCIIHCATDARNRIESKDLWPYYHSHIELTKALTEIPHDLFVFISSAAVYPNPSQSNKESDIVNLPFDPPLYGLYGLFKLLAEKVVQNYTSNSLILRTTAIVGRTSRRNNIVRVLNSHSNPLTLSGNSSYNLVSMLQIKKFIELALEKNLTGIFNVGATQNASLSEIAKAVNSQPTFGNHVHNVHPVDTTKIRRVSIEFNKDSLEVAREVAQELGAKL